MQLLDNFQILEVCHCHIIRYCVYLLWLWRKLHYWQSVFLSEGSALTVSSCSWLRTAQSVTNTELLWLQIWGISKKAAHFIARTIFLRAVLENRFFGKPESKSKVQAQSLFFKGVSNINKKYYHSWMGGLNLVFILYLNRNEWNKVLNIWKTTFLIHRTKTI